VDGNAIKHHFSQSSGVLREGGLKLFKVPDLKELGDGFSMIPATPGAKYCGAFILRCCFDGKPRD